jgi:hypothetical protein
VLVLEAAGATPVLIATTGDLRERLRVRLGLGEGDAPGALGLRGRTDYAAVVRSAWAAAAGSSFETELAYLTIARRLMPMAYRTVIERWRAWFVHVEPGAEFPQLRKTNLVGLASARRAGGAGSREGERRNLIEGGLLLGPIVGKDPAGRLIERLTDGFDLCRFQAILVQAPKATACAYKEMGRCPAACDGSESMTTYRERVRRAMTSFGPAAGESAAALQTEMTIAAAAGDYALAARHKRAMELVNDAKLGSLGLLTRQRAVMLLPGVVAKTVRVAVLDQGRMRWHEPIAVDEGLEQARSITAQLAAEFGDDDGGLEIDDEVIDVQACLARWQSLPAKRKRGMMVRVHESDRDGSRLETELVQGLRAVKRVKAEAIDAGGEAGDEVAMDGPEAR